MKCSDCREAERYIYYCDLLYTEKVLNDGQIDESIDLNSVQLYQKDTNGLLINIFEEKEIPKDCQFRLEQLLIRD